MSAFEGSNPEPPSPPTQWDQISEQQLDEAISRASALAGNLAREVSDADSLKADVNQSNSVQPRDADTEIEQLDKLLAETKRQVDQSDAGDSIAKSVSDHAPSNQDDPRKNVTRQAAVVPDFMSEFTHPEEPTSTVPEPADCSPNGNELAAGASPSSVAVAAPDLVRKKSSVPAPTFDGAIDSLPQTAGSPQRVLRRTVRILSDKVSAVASRICDSGIRALEAMDRPLTRIGPRVRSVLGWVGMALFAIAVVVLLFAHR